MSYSKKRFSSKGNSGFSLVELLIAVTILSILAGIAIPLYNDGKVQAGRAVAISDGLVLSAAINSMLLGVTDFGTGEGVIAITNLSRPATVSITLGVGATVIQDSTEGITLTTAASGKTYPDETWCLDVVNNTRHAIYNNNGYQKDLANCP